HQRNLRVVARFAARWPENAIEVRTKDRVPMDGAHHVLVYYDGSGKAAGLRVYVDGKPREPEIVKDTLGGTCRPSEPPAPGNKNTGGLFEGQLDDLRIDARTLTDKEAESLAVHYPARVLLTELAGAPAKEIATLQPDKPPEEADIGELAKAESKEEKQVRLEKQHQSRLTDYFLKHDAPEKYRQLYSRLAEL